MKIKVIKLFVFYCLIFIGLSKNIYAEELTNEGSNNANEFEYETTHNSYVTNTEEALDDLYMKLGDNAVSLKTIRSELEKVKDMIIEIKKEAANISTKEEALLNEKEKLLKTLSANLVLPEIKDYEMVFNYDDYNIAVNYEGDSFSASHSNSEHYASMNAIQTLIELYVFSKNGKTIENYLEENKQVNEKINNSPYDRFIFGNYKTNGFKKDYKIITEPTNMVYSWKFKISSSNISYSNVEIVPYTNESDINEDKNYGIEIENPNTGVGIMLLSISLIIIIIIIMTYVILSSKYRKYYRI